MVEWEDEKRWLTALAKNATAVDVLIGHRIEKKDIQYAWLQQRACNNRKVENFNQMRIAAKIQDFQTALDAYSNSARTWCKVDKDVSEYKDTQDCFEYCRNNRLKIAQMMKQSAKEEDVKEIFTRLQKYDFKFLAIYLDEKKYLDFVKKVKPRGLEFQDFNTFLKLSLQLEYARLKSFVKNEVKKNI